MILVTGSSGHLGEALIRTLREAGMPATGLDIKASGFTDLVGSIADRAFVRDVFQRTGPLKAVLHTATLHKPHVGTHSRQDFVDTNVSGTLNLLEEAAAGGCSSFIYTSTTSVFGDAMRPPPGEPAVWVTEELRSQPKNIYGVTKESAEHLCQIFQRNTGMPCLILRTSRFFPEPDDDSNKRDAFPDDDNLKVNELLFRRADTADMVSAHLRAVERAADIGFGRFIISAPTPFSRDEAADLGRDAPAVLKKHFPQFEALYESRGWKMFDSLDRVYDSSLARQVLGWEPRFTFEAALDSLAADQDYRSPLAQTIGAKGYHDVAYENGIYPVSSF